MRKTGHCDLSKSNYSFGKCAKLYSHLIYDSICQVSEMLTLEYGGHTTTTNWQSSWPPGVNLFWHRNLGKWYYQKCIEYIFETPLKGVPLETRNIGKRCYDRR